MLEEETDLKEVHDTLKILVSVSYKAGFRLYLSDTESMMPETAGQTRSDFTERQLPKNKRFKQETLVSQTVENGRALLFKTWEQHGQGLWV